MTGAAAGLLLDRGWRWRLWLVAAVLVAGSAALIGDGTRILMILGYVAGVSAYSAAMVYVLARGGRVSVFAPLAHGIGRFIKQYIMRGGFREGIDGLNVSIISAFGAYMKYAMAIETQRREGK